MNTRQAKTVLKLIKNRSKSIIDELYELKASGENTLTMQPQLHAYNDEIKELQQLREYLECEYPEVLI